MASFRDSYASMLRFASSKNCAGRLQGLLMTLLIVLLSLFAFLLYPTWLLNLASGQALAAVYAESAVTFAIDPSSIYYQGMKPPLCDFFLAESCCRRHRHYGWFNGLASWENQRSSLKDF